MPLQAAKNARIPWRRRLAGYFSDHQTIQKAGETPALPCLSLTRDIARHIVLRKVKVEIGNLAERVLSASGRRMSLDVQEA
jgi:hypothetical protein